MQREQSGQTFGCRQWRPHNVSRPTAPAISFWVTVCERWSLKHFRFDQPGSFRRENFSNRPGKIARQALIWASAADWRAACSFSIVFQGLVRLGKVVALIASGLRIKLTLLIRYRRRGAKLRPPVPPPGVNEHQLNHRATFLLAGFSAQAGCFADILPVGRPVAGPPVRRGDKGLEKHRSVTVPPLPVRSKSRLLSGRAKPGSATSWCATPKRLPGTKPGERKLSRNWRNSFPILRGMLNQSASSWPTGLRPLP